MGRKPLNLLVLLSPHKLNKSPIYKIMKLANDAEKAKLLMIKMYNAISHVVERANRKQMDAMKFQLVETS